MGALLQGYVDAHSLNAFSQPIAAINAKGQPKVYALNANRQLMEITLTELSDSGWSMQIAINNVLRFAHSSFPHNGPEVLLVEQPAPDTNQPELNLYQKAEDGSWKYLRKVADQTVFFDLAPAEQYDLAIAIVEPHTDWENFASWATTGETRSDYFLATFWPIPDFILA